MMYERFLRDFAQGLAGLRGCSSQASFDAERQAATKKFELSSESSVTVRSVSAVQWLVPVHVYSTILYSYQRRIQNEWPP